jgi:hypothetical protein
MEAKEAIGIDRTKGLAATGLFRWLAGQPAAGRAIHGLSVQDCGE